MVVIVIEVVMLLTVRGRDALYVVDRPRQDFYGSEVTCFLTVKLYGRGADAFKAA